MHGRLDHDQRRLPATPYPSTCVVSGVTGTVSDVNVNINGLTHTYPDDIDMLLVSPDGQNAIFMSDAGGGTPLSAAT